MKSSAAGITGYRRPLGYQQISTADLAAAKKITIPSGIPNGDQVGYLCVQCAGGVVRWRDDGTAPTASLGMRILADSELDYVGDIYSLQFIVASGSPILDISAYV